jgi:hypothetical protein
MKTARRIAAAKAVAAIAGLATAVLAAATGNWPFLLGTVAVAVAVVEGPALFAAAAALVADWKGSIAQAAEDRRLHQMEAAVEQERGRELGIEERKSELQGPYGCLDEELATGSGRFRQRVSGDKPPIWDRAH